MTAITFLLFSTAYVAPSRSEAIRQAFAAGAEAEIKGAASRNAAPIATIDYPRPRGCGAIGPTDSLNTVRRPSSQFKALMATMPLQPLSDQPSLKSSTPARSFTKNEICGQRRDYERKDHRSIHRTQAIVVASDKNCASNTEAYRNKVDQQSSKPTDQPLQIINSFPILSLCDFPDCQQSWSHLTNGRTFIEMPRYTATN